MNATPMIETAVYAKLTASKVKYLMPGTRMNRARKMIMPIQAINGRYPKAAHTRGFTCSCAKMKAAIIFHWRAESTLALPT